MSTYVLAALFFATVSARTSSGTAAARARARGGVIRAPERVDSQQVCYVPRFEPTYNMSRSTIVMPCSDSGYFNTSLTARFGVVDFDWSNAKQIVRFSPRQSVHDPYSLTQIATVFARP